MARKSACVKKQPESHIVFLVSGAHARLLSLPLTVRSAHYVAGRGRGDSAEGYVPRDQKPE